MSDKVQSGASCGHMQLPRAEPSIARVSPPNKRMQTDGRFKSKERRIVRTSEQCRS